MAKPDNRADNAKKIQRIIQNTEDNYTEAENYLKAHQGEISGKEQEEIQNKNERRLESMEGFRNEVKDEVSDQKNNS